MTTHILILCTHNSARSVLAEGMFNHWAQALGTDARAHSAGSAPSGRINPMAVEVLEAAGIDTSSYRSKSWDEFAAPGAPALRVVITVCDSAANETCPYWPGSPVTMHWGYPDPSNAGTNAEEKRAAFESTRQAIGERMRKLAQTPFDTLDDAQLRAALQGI
ncbi:arsenate reductase ArsC [Variovorax boronicumulans]|uniref:arsenate reductase ArsC n=1 Tax=Variovorax boronicumulans TaxID=436515 RepID=UPI003394BBB0